jgi:hypothetical protein
MQPFACCASEIELELLLSLFLNHLRTVPAVKGPRAPRRNGAPLTAPGRSEETLPDKRERTVGKLMTRHLPSRRFSNETTHALLRLETPAQRQQRAGCRNLSRLPAREGAFSLDILFIEPKGCRFESWLRSQTFNFKLEGDFC